MCLVEEEVFFFFRKPQYVFIQHGDTLPHLTMDDLCETRGDGELRETGSVRLAVTG